MTTTLPIVTDTAGRFFAVRETGDADLAHVWLGVEMKRAKGAKGGFVPKANACEHLIRKAGTRRVIHAST